MATTIRFADLARDIVNDAGLNKFAAILAKATEILGRQPSGDDQVMVTETKLLLDGKVLAVHG